MIGMNQIKKRLINGILIGLAIGLLFIIITILIAFNIVKGYKEGTNKDFLANYTSEVVTYTRDVVQGETITADMLQSTRVHNNTVPSGAVLSTGQAVGRIAKYNMTKNATLVSNMITDKITTVDARIQEISAILLPTDLVVNDYVDIRLMYPSGIEYIVLAQKQVTKISGTTIWMDMTEEETLMLNSAIVDSYLTDGTKLYAVRYSDPTTQIKLTADEATMEAARTYIKNKIGNEIAGITVDKATEIINNAIVATDKNAGTTPTVSEKQTAATQTTATVTGDTTATSQTIAPQVTATDKIIDLVTKYAIEYRYYIESYNKLETNYQPNSQVMNFMKTNKYIVDQAKEKLNLTIRQGIENNIALFENSNSEGYSSVVAGINTAISAQQSLRNSTLAQ